MPPTRVPIVSGATAYDVPGSNETIILVVNEELYFGTKLDHSLFNRNQMRSYKIPVWDNPFDEMRPEMGIDLGSYFVPFQSKGTKIRFKSRSPTERELAECCHVDITSKIPWTPESVQLSEVISNNEGKDEMEDPRSNSFDLSWIPPKPMIIDHWMFQSEGLLYQVKDIQGLLLKNYPNDGGSVLKEQEQP